MFGHFCFWTETKEVKRHIVYNALFVKQCETQPNWCRYFVLWMHCHATRATKWLHVFLMSSRCCWCFMMSPDVHNVDSSVIWARACCMVMVYTLLACLYIAPEVLTHYWSACLYIVQRCFTHYLLALHCFRGT